MSLRKLNPLWCFSLLIVAVFALTPSASAKVRVGGWSLRANGQLAQGFQYTGACPVSLKFGWGVIATEPTPVTYTFVRSDGGHSNTSFTTNLPAANQSVPIYDDWQLGANTPEFQNYSGWVQLNIESPNPVSQKIPFTIHCGGSAAPGPSVRVGGWSLRANGQLAQGFQYTGPCPVALKFGWGVIATEPTPVTYTFVRSDGGHSNTSFTTNLPAANQSVPIYDDWQLGANTPEFQNYSGWVQLNIESPNPVSQKVPFTIHCGGPSVRVGGWSLRANGQLAQGFQYTGACPVSLKFGWGVIATEPTPVTYTFVRSDGGHLNASLTTDLPAANQSVPIYDDWQLGANTPEFQNYSGWVQLNIESPNPVSQKIQFTIHCSGD